MRDLCVCFGYSMWEYAHLMANNLKFSLFSLKLYIYLLLFYCFPLGNSFTEALSYLQNEYLRFYYSFLLRKPRNFNGNHKFSAACGSDRQSGAAAAIAVATVTPTRMIINDFRSVAGATGDQLTNTTHHVRVNNLLHGFRFQISHFFLYFLSNKFFFCHFNCFCSSLTRLNCHVI